MTICGYFKNFLRISSEDLEWLTNALGPYIGEENTTFREAISVTTRLTYTLRFLATGDSYHSLSVEILRADLLRREEPDVNYFCNKNGLFARQKQKNTQTGISRVQKRKLQL